MCITSYLESELALFRELKCLHVYYVGLVYIKGSDVELPFLVLEISLSLFHYLSQLKK